MSEFPIDTAIGQRMLGYLPGFYEAVNEFRMIMETEGVELEDQQGDLSAVLDQAFVDSATWGLDRWETELGIIPPAGQPYDQRRTVILSRIRGTGTVTMELIKRVANSFENSEIEVTQSPALYTFTVAFVDVLGLPPNIGDLQAAIEAIKPAHLAVVYEYTYITFGDLEGYGLTFGELAGAGITFGELDTWGGL
jgi:uncharacterized protein YmfQ (DUF2313 family)